MTVPRRCALGIGQPAGGDDAVGILVARWLRGRVAASDVSVREITEPLQLVEALVGVEKAAVVDAVVGPQAPGRVMRLGFDEFEHHRITPLSSHGVDVGTAVLLAKRLNADIAEDICFIGVTIQPPMLPRYGVSSVVAAAVPRAAALVCEVLGAQLVR